MSVKMSAPTQGLRGFPTVGDTSWVQMMGIRLIVSDLHLVISGINSRVGREDGGIRWKTYRYCGGGKTLLPMLLEKGTTDCCLLINNHKSDKTLINATP
jgi:hypothetical protein